MPKSDATISRAFVIKPDSEKVLASALTAMEAIVELPILELHKRNLIDLMLWKLTEAHGKFKTRYRSQGVLNEPDSDIQHEHVNPRKDLVNQILKCPERSKEIAATATACLVTKDEHTTLTRISRDRPDLIGWDRYRAAGIVVYEMVDRSVI